MMPVYQQHIQTKARPKAKASTSRRGQRITQKHYRDEEDEDEDEDEDPYNDDDEYYE
jgi:hypothetical protein